MEIEYEAAFADVVKDDIRKRLSSSDANLIRSEFLQKRVVFNFPSGHEIKGGWMRVRDEGDKVTMSLKIIDGTTITDQKEICLEISDFKKAVEMLKLIGCEEKAFQESKRELWKLDEVEITIDEWPFLEPFVEIEGTSEEAVRKIASRLGLDWNKAKFCAVGTLYAEKYSISEDVINNDIPRIVFDMKNPFV
ncbi:MAG: CYTH domain-containing protein [Candidatus Colwellbacteria bacterium]|nr:CYTH domain-containing protein [Candidatus Colwellbacteria bacterium]